MLKKEDKEFIIKILEYHKHCILQFWDIRDCETEKNINEIIDILRN